MLTHKSRKIDSWEFTLSWALKATAHGEELVDGSKTELLVSLG
jgi:hypothetical protein